MNDIKAKGTQAFIWDFLGKLGVHASSFIVTIILARLLEPSDFGLIALILVIVSLAMVFSDIGLGGAIIQRKRLHQIHYSSVFFFNITAGAILTLITFFSAPLIANFYENQQLIPVIQATSFLFFISSFHTVQTVILKKELRFEILTKVNLIASVASGIIGVLLALFGAGVWSLVAQLISREIIINIVIWSKTSWIPQLAFSFKALKQLWAYGMNMFLADVLDTIYEKADYLIIGKFFGPATLGYFHQAKQLNLFVIEYTSGSLMAVLFPVLSKIQNDLARFQRVVIQSTCLISFVVFLLLGVLYLVADELIVILLGEKWVSSVYFFKIILLSGFAYPISALMVNVLSSRGKSKDYLRLEIYKKIIQTVNLYVLYAFGIQPFLYSLILSSLLGTSLNIRFATREIKLSFWVIIQPICIQAIISIATVAFITYSVSQIYMHSFILILIKAVLFLLIYISINWFFHIKSFELLKKQIEIVLEFLKKRRRERIE